MHLLFREPGSVLDCLLYILASNVRIAFKNVIECSAMGDLTNNHRYRDAHPRIQARPPMMFGSNVILSNMISSSGRYQFVR